MRSAKNIKTDRRKAWYSRGLGLLLFLLCLPLAPLRAEEPGDAVLQFALTLEAAGLESQALLEFKRYVFVRERLNREVREEVYLHIAKMYKAENEREKALAYFQKYQNAAPSLSAEDYRFELDLLERLGFNDGARIRLFALALKRPPYPEIFRLTLLKNLTVAARLHDWENLRFFFALAGKEALFAEADKEALDSLILEGEQFRPLSPGLVQVFSVVLPGAGQLAAGYPGDALNAFLLNGSLIGLSVFSLSSGNIGDFALLEFPNLARFYQGNIANAKVLAEKRNSAKESEIAGKLLKILEVYSLE